MEDFDHCSAADVDWVTGASLIVRRQAIAAVGLMDDVRVFSVLGRSRLVLPDVACRLARVLRATSTRPAPAHAGAG